MSSAITGDDEASVEELAEQHKDLLERLTGELEGDVKEVLPISPGKTISVKGVTIKAVPAYNTNKPFHPKENEWVGYVLTVDGVTIYHAGDTGLFGDMRIIGEEGLDLALLPIGDRYTMGTKDAVKATELLNPNMVIPMHYGTFPVINPSPEEFKKVFESKFWSKAPNELALLINTTFVLFPVHKGSVSKELILLLQTNPVPEIYLQNLSVVNVPSFKLKFVPINCNKLPLAL